MPPTEIQSKTAQPTISAVAISKNEERDLPGFLACLMPVVDEIIIVDDDSSDCTRAIATEAGEKVVLIDHKRTDAEGFAGQRNAGIRAASSDWLLHMDVDERPTGALIKELRNAIKQTSLNAFRYRRLNFFLHRPMRAGGWTSWNNPQLARRGFHHFEGKVHEKCVVDGSTSAIGQLHARMLHLNDENYEERLRKSMQYCKLEAEKTLQAKRKISALQIICMPVCEFFKKYFIKFGFRDGVPGLISAMHAACATFRTLALVWDAQNRIPREDLESIISVPAKAEQKPTR